MSKVKITGHASGSGTLTLTGPDTNSDRTITLPDSTGTVLTLDGGAMTGTLTNFTSTGIDDNADATAITIDSSENVGIGNTTPESWDASATALQLGTEAALVDYSGQTWLAQNYYFDGAHKYITTDEASRYRQYGGNHSFEVAASGTADAAITWTEALQITNDGRGLSDFTIFAAAQLGDLSTTPAAENSTNVSSVTDVSTGRYACNYTNNTGGNKATVTISGQNRTRYDEIYHVDVDSSSTTKMQGGCTLSGASAGWHDTHKMTFLAVEIS